MPPLLRFDDSPLTGARRDRALRLLNGPEMERFETATDPHPERFLTGRMLLRELVAELSGRELGSITVTAACPDCGREHGQPRVSGLHVSLSHAGDRVIAAAHPDRAIGVDIESRDVSPERVAAIRTIAGAGGLEHWTRIEAVLKADGRGLRVDPRAVRLDGDTATLDGSRYELADASDDRYIATVATRLP